MLVPFPAARRALVASALALAAGCSEETPTSTGIIHPTLVTVSPEAFLGDVPCLDAPGAMRSFVATLRHQGPADDDGVAGESGVPDESGGAGGAAAEDGGTLPLVPPQSSSPTDCSKVVGFGNVAPDHRYLADIYAYDRAGLALIESGDGAPTVVDAVTEEPVLPRWTTRCSAITARYAVIRKFHDCEPLVDHLPEAPAAVHVELGPLLGELTCGSAPGQIERFEVTGPSGRVSAACGETVILDDVVADRSLVLPLAAYEAGGTLPVLGTTCVADPGRGVTVQAACDPLTDKGSLDVDPAAASAVLGLDCATLGELNLVPPVGAARRVRPSDCGRVVQFAGVPRGPGSVRALPVLSDGSSPAGARCEAVVLPAARVLTTCAPEP